MFLPRPLLFLLAAAAIAPPVLFRPLPLAEGSPAPPFVLNGAHQAFGSSDAPAVIAFLDFSEPAGMESGPSRLEADELASLLRLAGGAKLKAVVVDAAPTVMHRVPAVDLLAARAREWGLVAVPLVQDHAIAGLARRYGVTGTPCVFLLDGGGIVRGRWDRPVSAQEIEARLALLAWGQVSH